LISLQLPIDIEISCIVEVAGVCTRNSCLDCWCLEIASCAFLSNFCSYGPP